LRAVRHCDGLALGEFARVDVVQLVAMADGEDGLEGGPVGQGGRRSCRWTLSPIHGGDGEPGMGSQEIQNGVGLG
jgi:hypothetical protein